MLTIEECRQSLGDAANDLTDEQIENLRDALYGLCDSVLNQQFSLESPG